MRRGIRAEYRRNDANRSRAIHLNEINRPRVIRPNEKNIYAQSNQMPPTVRAHNSPKRHQPSTRNPSKRNRRGGAYVPARTSRSGVSIPKITYHARGMNDGCALVGRHGRAHRHRPYQTPLYFSTQSHTNKIPSMRNSPQTKSTVHVQSVPTNLHQTTRCAITPSGLYFR